MHLIRLLPIPRLPPSGSLELNAIQSSQSSRAKKKGKGKSKNPMNQQESTKTQTIDVESKPKRMAKFPFLICGFDHFIKDFPHRKESNKFMKGISTSTVLTNPFPTQK